MKASEVSQTRFQSVPEFANNPPRSARRISLFDAMIGAVGQMVVNRGKARS